MHILYQIRGTSDQIGSAEKRILDMMVSGTYPKLDIQIQTSLPNLDVPGNALPTAFKLAVDIPGRFESDEDALVQFRAFVEEVHKLHIGIIDLLQNGVEV